MNLAVGFFDGVHLGHRQILLNADYALTFNEHPSRVFAPDRMPPLLMDRDMRVASIAAALRGGAQGTARVRALDFTEEFAQMPPVAFAEWLRREYPELERMYCGPNWTFGAGGAGDAGFLRDRGFSVECVPFVAWGGEVVSSTRIRGAVADGRMEEAASMLGAPWRVTGTLRHGKGLGSKIGFPTANFALARALVAPPHGVFAVATRIGRGVANWGEAPTLGDDAWSEPVLEVHFPGREIELAEGECLEISFLRFLRPERRFSSIAELASQIAEDVRSV